MTDDQVQSCSQETMGADNSNNQGLERLKTRPSFMPHLVEVITRCSEPTRTEIKEELLDYLDDYKTEGEDSDE